MKKYIQIFCIQLVLGFGCWAGAFNAMAQEVQIGVDAVYFENGEVALDLRLKDITSDKVITKSNLTAKEAPFSRSRVLMAFSKQGNFLVITELPVNLEQARQKLQEFLNAPPRKDKNDYLIKASPLTVIPGQIKYESPEVVNYLSPGGNSGSIPKSQLVAILYKDGRHMLIKPANEVAPLLAELRPDIENGGKPVDLPTPPKPAPVDSLLVTGTGTQGKGNKLVLTEEEKETYRQKSLDRVEQFVDYINIITDKNRNSDDKDEAIKQAKRLFLPGSSIEITSTKRAGSRTLGVEEYLERLRRLPYLFTKVQWFDAQFVQDLEKMPDGSYEGIITGEQRFTGVGAGQMSYKDVVQKNVRVKLESYQKIINGDSTVRWQPMLGNVSVNFDPK